MNLACGIEFNILLQVYVILIKLLVSCSSSANNSASNSPPIGSSSPFTISKAANKDRFKYEHVILDILKNYSHCIDIEQVSYLDINFCYCFECFKNRAIIGMHVIVKYLYKYAEYRLL